MKRKGFLYCVLLCAACVFLPFFSGNTAKKNDSLKDLAKTYLGVYDCKEMRYGGKDLSEYIKSVTMELKEGGNYEVNLTLKSGEKKKASGRYEAEKDKITLIYCGKNGDTKREFSRTEDKITINCMIHGKALYLVFSRGE